MNLEAGVNHGQIIYAHLAGAYRVIDRIRAGANVAFPFLIAHAVVNAEHFGLSVRRECRPFENLPGDFCAFDSQIQVVWIGQIVGVDAGIGHWVGAEQKNTPSGFRPQVADVATEAVSPMQFTGVILHDGDDEVQLQVWLVLLRVRLQECRPLCKGRGNHTRPIRSPLEGMAKHVFHAR